MKNVLFAMGLLASSSFLAAQDGRQGPANNDNGAYHSGCCPTDCCEPCCTPQPRPCINCCCYVPQFYILQCDWGAFLDVEFLYWYSRETNLEFAEKFTMLSSVSSQGSKSYAVPTKYYNFDAAWDPGVRVGIGSNMSCDGWDLYLNWTYYHSSEKGCAAATPPYNETYFPRGGDEGIFNPWINGGLLFESAFNKVEAKWVLTFNQIDLELGKKFWLSRCFNLRPFVGIRGGWTKTTFKVTDYTLPLTNPDIDVESFNEIDIDSYKNRLWGVGLLAGIQADWVLGRCGCGDFSIFGNLDGSLIWGEFKGRRHEDSAFEQTFTDETPPQTFDETRIAYDSCENFFKMTGILDLSLGLRWEEYWCCDRYMTTIDLGWEHHYWINHGVRHQALSHFNDDLYEDQNQFYPVSVNVISDLVFGGFVLRARFDF